MHALHFSFKRVATFVFGFELSLYIAAKQTNVLFKTSIQCVCVCVCDRKDFCVAKAKDAVHFDSFFAYKSTHRTLFLCVFLFQVVPLCVFTFGINTNEGAARMAKRMNE